MDKVLDTGKYWFKIKTSDKATVLLKCNAPRDFSTGTHKEYWEVVRVGSRKERQYDYLFDRIDDFFGTEFSEVIKKNNSYIYKTDKYYYRVSLKNGKLYLQQCVTPSLKYSKTNVVTSDFTWQDIHNGERLLIRMDLGLLKKINDFFKTDFGIIST